MAEILFPSFNRRRFLTWLSQSSGQLHFFTPFFTEAGRKLIAPSLENNQINLLVRADIADFISGVLSVEALENAMENGWTIKYYSKLHAKIYWDEARAGFIGSGNLTNSGLGHPPVGNLEVFSFSQEFEADFIDEMFFYWDKAKFVTKDTIEEMKAYLLSIDYPNEKIEFESPWRIENIENDRLRYSLRHIVQSESITLFYNKLKDGGDDSQEFNHDFNLLDATADTSLEELFESFNLIPLIDELIKYTGNGRRFGDLRKWLKGKIEDVPTPSQDDFNTQLNKLYSLVVEANPGRYERFTPGVRSEWLRKVVK